MQAGKLRHKIVIQENRYARDELNLAQRDAYGAPINRWIDVWPCRASMEPLSGREYFSSQQIQAEATTRFRIRYPRFQIWPGMRIKYRDPVLEANRYFDIQAVIDQNEMHTDLFLMAIEQIKPLLPGGVISTSSSSSGDSSGAGPGTTPEVIPGQITKSWTPSPDPRVVGYILRWVVPAGTINYSAAGTFLGNVFYVALPVAGMPLTTGTMTIGITAVDDLGDESAAQEDTFSFNFLGF